LRVMPVPPSTVIRPQDRYSIGFVEVAGLSAALVVADVMCKGGNVRLAGIESNGAGGMGIKVTGSTGDVQAAVEEGESIARRMHALIAEVTWSHYAEEADFLIHADQEYNEILENNEHLLPPGGGTVAAEDRKGTSRTMAKHDAIGLIETQGLVGMIEAADVMLKTAAVEVIGKEKIGAAYVTVMVRGDVAAVRAAVDAGAKAVEQVGGKLILSHVIPRPHEDLASLLP